MKLLSFGEVLWDVFPDEKQIGGAPLNFAAHFVKCGGSSALISAVGNDSLGKETLNKVNTYNICTKYITKVKDKITGCCNVTLDENAIPKYDLLNDVAYDYIATDNISEKGSILYFGTLALRNEFNRKSLESLIKENDFAQIFVDVNIRPPFFCEDSVKLAVKNATLLKISDEELPIVIKLLNLKENSIENISRELADKYKKLKLIIITKGEKGSFAYDVKTDICHYADCIKEKTVSTVGAGDSFGAAFLYKYLQNESVDNCLKYGAERSAYVVAHKGAIPE